MPILPKVCKGNLVLPIPTVVLTYGAYLTAALVILGARSNIMTTVTMIPDESLLPVILTIILVALFAYVTLYLVAYVERRTEILNMKRKARETGTEVDPLDLERVKNFHSIYIAAMLLGAIVSAVVSFVIIITAIPTYIGVPTGTPDYVITALITTAAVSFLLDRYFCHPIADGTFKKKVIDPFIDNAIAAFPESAQDKDKN